MLPAPLFLPRRDANFSDGGLIRLPDCLTAVIQPVSKASILTPALGVTEVFDARQFG